MKEAGPTARFFFARKAYFAAMTAISTLKAGAASFASTVARAGVLPGETQASHTAFISWNVAMSVIQMLVIRIFDLSVPASASRLSMMDRISFVCSVTLWPAVWL